MVPLVMDKLQYIMKERLLELSSRINSIKHKIKNEEATKQSMILPFLQILGYDIFNPEEVEPEVACDISGKGDRVDYVICKDGKQEILIECKDWRLNITSYVSQLGKYFVASDARFAILTNGIKYLFFSDHDKANIMDKEPFFSFDITSVSDDDTTVLSGFRKDSYNTMQLLSQSQDLRYRDAILSNIRREISNPSKGLVSLLTADFYRGKLHEPIYAKFSGIIKDCLELILSEGWSKENKEYREEHKVPEDVSKYTEDEQKVIDIVKGWLINQETDKYHIYIKKLSDGYIRFCYSNEWWNICRIKVAWDKRLYVKICRGGLAANSVRHDVKNIEDLESVRNIIESQCEETKSKFFQYRIDHNL